MATKKLNVYIDDNPPYEIQVNVRDREEELRKKAEFHLIRAINATNRNLSK